MLKSMTGYAKASGATAAGSLDITIKSYNNKFCDISFKMPRFLYEIENELTAITRDILQRGKIYVNLEFADFSGETIALNEIILKQYISELKKVDNMFAAAQIEIKKEIDFAGLLKLPEIIRQTPPTIDINIIKKQIIGILNTAIETIDSMRAAEAANLLPSIKSNLEEIIGNIEIIKRELPDTLKNYREKLVKNVDELNIGFSEDNERKILMEIAFFTDKIDVSEELERLKSHILQFEKYLCMNNSEPVGKTLEFLLQEMNREINTCSVKSMNSEISKAVVNIKNLLDKIKEQIMNLV